MLRSVREDVLPHCSPSNHCNPSPPASISEVVLLHVLEQRSRLPSRRCVTISWRDLGHDRAPPGAENWKKPVERMSLELPMCDGPRILGSHRSITWSSWLLHMGFRGQSHGHPEEAPVGECLLAGQKRSNIDQFVAETKRTRRVDIQISGFVEVLAWLVSRRWMRLSFRPYPMNFVKCPSAKTAAAVSGSRTARDVAVRFSGLHCGRFLGRRLLEPLRKTKTDPCGRRTTTEGDRLASAVQLPVVFDGTGAVVPVTRTGGFGLRSCMWWVPVSPTQERDVTVSETAVNGKPRDIKDIKKIPRWGRQPPCSRAWLLKTSRRTSDEPRVRGAASKRRAENQWRLHTAIGIEKKADGADPCTFVLRKYQQRFAAVLSPARLPPPQTAP